MPPFYDSGARYDTGLRYAVAGGTTNTTTPKKAMATFKLNLSRKNIAQLIQFCEVVLPKVKPAAPGVPPVADVEDEATALAASLASLKTLSAAYEAAKVTLANLKQQRDDAGDGVRKEMTALANVVTAKTKGAAAPMLATGIPLAGDATTTTTPPAKVVNFELTAGDNDGSVDGQHDPVLYAASYEAEYTTVDPVNGPWLKGPISTASSFTISGLTSGQRVWVRVRAIGAQGEGPWSDPATKIVP